MRDTGAERSFIVACITTATSNCSVWPGASWNSRPQSSLGILTNSLLIRFSKTCVSIRHELIPRELESFRLYKHCDEQGALRYWFISPFPSSWHGRHLLFWDKNNVTSAHAWLNELKRRCPDHSRPLANRCRWSLQAYLPPKISHTSGMTHQTNRASVLYSFRP